MILLDNTRDILQLDVVTEKKADGSGNLIEITEIEDILSNKSLLHHNN